MRLRWLWWLFVGLGYCLSYFDIVSVPKDWGATLKWIAPIEQWWVSHAAHPTFAAFFAGLTIGTVLLPELWSQIRPHVFPEKPKPTITAAAAYQLVLRRSKWVRRQMKDWKSLPSVRYETSRDERAVAKERIELALNKRIHTLLRQSELKSWGCPTDGTELEEEISADKWSAIQIWFEERDLQNDRVHAWRLAPDIRNNHLAYTSVRMSRKELLRAFPLTILSTRVTNASKTKTVTSQSAL
jgi:hypothetical protein